MLSDLDIIKQLLSKSELDERERAFIKENINCVNWYLSQQEIEKIWGYKDIVNTHEVSRETPIQ